MKKILVLILLLTVSPSFYAMNGCFLRKGKGQTYQEKEVFDIVGELAEEREKRIEGLMEKIKRMDCGEQSGVAADSVLELEIAKERYLKTVDKKEQKKRVQEKNESQKLFQTYIQDLVDTNRTDPIVVTILNGEPCAPLFKRLFSGNSSEVRVFCNDWAEAIDRVFIQKSEDESSSE